MTAVSHTVPTRHTAPTLKFFPLGVQVTKTQHQHQLVSCFQPVGGGGGIKSSNPPSPWCRLNIVWTAFDLLSRNRVIILLYWIICPNIYLHWWTMKMESCVWPTKSEFLHFVYCFSLCIDVSGQLDWMQFFTVTDIMSVAQRIEWRKWWKHKE